MDPAQHLITQLELKVVSIDQRLIEGYAAVFSVVDRTGDVIDKGAFDRTLKESNGDVLVFIGHDSSKLPVGEPVEIRSDDRGLYCVTRVYGTSEGDALLQVARERMSSGRSLGLSIGYRTVGQKWVGKTRHLLDLDLVEYSYLASPAMSANPLAVSIGVKTTGTGNQTAIISQAVNETEWSGTGSPVGRVGAVAVSQQQTKNDPRAAAVWAAEAAARDAALNEALDQLGIPHEPRGAAAWHERAADRARLEAGRQELAALNAVAAQLERDELQDRAAAEQRERDRVAELAEGLAHIDKLLTDGEDRARAIEVRHELAEAQKRETDYRARASALRVRKAFGLPLTAGETKLVERFPRD